MFRIVSILMIVLASNLKSQNIDGLLLDAIRYSSDEKIYNTRSAGLGFSYLGIINDQAAIHYNPAGLTLNPRSEISAGFNVNMNNNNSAYLGQSNSDNVNSYNLTNIGISSPIRSYYNSENYFCFAISYSNSMSYNNNISVGAFNPEKSYINSESNKVRNWTENTGLSEGGVTLINDSLTQNYSLTESGGHHDLAFSMAMEFDEHFSFGGTMNISFGYYNYLRFLDESDTRNKYENESEAAPYEDLDKSYHTLEYDHTYAQINFNFGILYNVDENLRFSLNLQTPSTLRLEEVFYEEAEVLYDDGDRTQYNNFSSDNTAIYDVLLPWSISFGSSYHIEGLTIAGAVQYKGYTWIDFLEPTSDYTDGLNGKIYDQLNGRFKAGVGVEYQIPNSIFQVRGGAEIIGSPIEGESRTTNIISGGLSAFITEAFRFDIFGKMLFKEYDNYIYDEQFINVSQSKTFLGAGFTYRY